VTGGGGAALATRSTGPRRSRAAPALAVLVGYLLASLWLWHALLGHLSTRALGGGSFDAGLFIWWLKWAPFAIGHGLDPLRTTYLDAPGGIDAMWNTSVLALATVFAPVTQTLGAVVSYNLACMLGPPLTAWATYFWLRRHGSPGAAALGGLLFGFSPFVIAHGWGGDLNFLWMAPLPLLAMLVEDLLWRSSRPVWPAAPLLGVLVAVELLISSEVLLIFVVAAVSAAVILAVRRPRSVRPRLGRLLPAAGVALVVAVALCAWPVAELYRTGQRIRQPVHPLGAYGGTPGLLVHATSFLYFHAASAPGVRLSRVENGEFLGWPLLAGLVVVVVLLVRRPGVLVAALAIGVSLALQMEIPLVHRSDGTVVTALVFAQEHLPLVQDVLAPRLAIVTWLAAAWLLTVGVQAAADRIGRRGWRHLPLLAGLGCLVPLLPSAIAPIPSLVPTAALFTTSLSRTIPAGSTVMIAPLATVGDASAELWQVQAGMRFRQLGGYALHAAGPNAIGSYYPPDPALVTLFQINHVNYHAYPGPVTPGLIRAARAELRRSGARLFLLGPAGGSETRLLSISEHVLGRGPDRVVGGVDEWVLATG
jgi:hypothetical protein